MHWGLCGSHEGPVRSCKSYPNDERRTLAGRRVAVHAGSSCSVAAAIAGTNERMACRSGWAAGPGGGRPRPPPPAGRRDAAHRHERGELRAEPSPGRQGSSANRPRRPAVIADPFRCSQGHRNHPISAQLTGLCGTPLRDRSRDGISNSNPDVA